MDEETAAMTPGVPERVSPLVVRLLAPNPSPMTLTGTNTYLVGEAEVAVIDPGPDLPEHVDAIVETLERLGRPAISLVTHHHGDHLPAAVRLRDRLGIPIGGHPDLPGVDRALADGEMLALADASLLALHTPGHTPDHVCYLLENEGALFSGDLMAGVGTVRVGDGRGELAAYLDSLDLVAQRGPMVIYPGHGPIVTDPAAHIAGYREHRLGRERQVLEALLAGCTAVTEIVERLYIDVPRHLHAQAGRNVLAHLMKLEDEGRAQRRAERWSLTGTGT